MSLISKRTFRKWAKALTDRGLTVENADVVAEIGNTVYVKGAPQPVGDPSIKVTFDVVSFTVGAVWLNGHTYTYPSFPPGSTGTLVFNSSSNSDFLIYCFVPYIAVVNYRPTNPISPPGPEEPSYQVIRVDINGDINFEIVEESEVTPEYENTPSIVDSLTGACTAGWTRRLLVRLTKSTFDGKWYASVASQNPEELLIFNMQSTVFGNQIALVPTGELI